MGQSSIMCGKCGVDVSTAKRFKDSKGRFFCAPCAAALKAHAHPPQHAQHSSDSTDMMPSLRLPPEPPPPDDGIIALADEPAAAPPPRVRPNQIDTCPDCGVPMAPSQNVCKGCGFNKATGHHMGKGSAVDDMPGEDRPKHRLKPCKKCGYDLSGLKTGRCPECGTINRRIPSARESEQNTLRAMYITPLIMTAIGLAIAIAVHFGRGMLPSGAGGLAHVVQFLILFAVTIPIGFVTYVGCSMAFIGFDEPLGVTFVRLMGVNAVTAAVAAVLRGALGGFGFGWGSWIIEWLVFVGLLMQIMELDFEDAWVVAAVTYVVQIVIGAVAIWAIITYF